MDMKRLSPPIKAQFRATLDNYHKYLWIPSLSGEIDFINRTVAVFRKLSIFTAKQSLKTRAKKIHLTPLVKYYRSTLFSPSQPITVELADLLFIYKHFLNGVLNAYRAIVVQTKYTKGKKESWKIDTDQFYLLTRWPRFRIVRPVSKRAYSIKPRAFTWAVYGFIGPKAARCPVYYSSKRMVRKMTSIPSSNTFSFPVQKPIGWDSSTSFLLKFIQGLVGENLLHNSKARTFVDDLYFAKWNPNPPSESKWENENEERGGFGIVEFAVFTERGEQ